MEAIIVPNAVSEDTNAKIPYSLGPRIFVVKGRMSNERMP